MLTAVPESPWWLIVFLALFIVRSLEGLVCQLGEYLRPRITETLQRLKAVIADRWARWPGTTAGIAENQGLGIGESHGSSGTTHQGDAAIPGLGILLDVILFCAALPGSTIILYVGLELVLPQEFPFFPLSQLQETANYSVSTLLLRALFSPAGIMALFVSLVGGLLGAHLFESVETREAYHLHTLWQRPPLVLMLVLLSIAEGVLGGARTYYYLYAETIRNPPPPSALPVIEILKTMAVIVLVIVGIVVPWAMALGAAACRNGLDTIGHALLLFWRWTVGMLSKLWKWIVSVLSRLWGWIMRVPYKALIELMIPIIGWCLIWGFRALLEIIIGLIRAGAALWRGPTTILGSALTAFRDWLRKWRNQKTMSTA